MQRGDSLPHFEVRTLAGETVSYSRIWQHKNLMLVLLPSLDSPAATTFAAEVTARLREVDDRHVACVITRDQISGLSAPAVVVADKWGEVVFVAQPSDVAEFPSPQELTEWLTYVITQCPECEGEAK